MDSKEKKSEVKEEKLEDIIRSIRGIIDDHNNHALKNLKGDKENPNLDESILELTSEFKEDEQSKVYTDGLISKETSDKFSEAIKGFAEKIDGPILKKENTDADLIITNLIKPMLKEWLDNNLPRLVEKVIAEELKKLIPKK